MSIVSIPRDGATRPRLRTRAVRIASIILVAGSLGGLAVVGPLDPQSADAATSGSSELTVKWTGDDSRAAEFQPVRDTGSPHFREFDDLELTVSQTEGLGDQALTVTAVKFAGTRSNNDYAINAMNFLQAMQCWGVDPLAPKFMETCQWGGRYGSNSGVGGSVFGDNVLRVSGNDANIYSPTKFDVPFRTVDGIKVTGKPVLTHPDVSNPLTGVERYELLDFFDPSVTNEVTSARVSSLGKSTFDFEAQTADQAPQLGCGTSGHLRCWLVIVPRGTVFGGNGDECSSIRDSSNGYKPYERGRPNSIQGGSPVNPKCDYWENRINIPLDFSPVGSACAVGGTEQRVIGSQLMIAAMSSWQPALCRSLQTTYSFATNPDVVAREQLLNQRAQVGFTGFPLSPGELGTAEERQKLADSKFVYAPVGVSGVVFAFHAEFYAGKITQMNLSPRLVAKLLTQSYIFTVPWNSKDPDKNFAHLPEVNRSYLYLNQDPEFQALNPTNHQAFVENPAIILPGPGSADGIRQVWRWITADRDAVNFLNGDPDPSGMTINPYYLPKGAVGAHVPTFTAGGEYAMDGDKIVQRLVGLTQLNGDPLRLSTAALDTLPRSDESTVPLKLTTEKNRFDSLQFAPFAENMLSAARSAFRANPNAKVIWDENKLNASGSFGDWVSAGPQIPGSRFVIALTDSPTAIRYALPAASLRGPNSELAVQPDQLGLEGGLAGLSATSLDSVRQVDPSKTQSSGYPLTIVTYAAANLSSSTSSSRAVTLGLLNYATTTGQKSGGTSGGLPAGYLPLTASMGTEASAALQEINRYAPPAPKVSPAPQTNGNAIEDPSFDENGSSSDALEGAADPSITESLASDPAARTEAIADNQLARVGLVLALGVGLTGFLFAPIFLRRKGFI